MRRAFCRMTVLGFMLAFALAALHQAWAAN
jgi:hypothetical protein